MSNHPIFYILFVRGEKGEVQGGGEGEGKLAGQPGWTVEVIV